VPTKKLFKINNIAMHLNILEKQKEKTKFIKGKHEDQSRNKD
jgi:hypothetical protein